MSLPHQIEENPRYLLWFNLDRQVNVFPNSKPRLNPAVRDVLHKKCDVFLNNKDKERVDCKKTNKNKTKQKNKAKTASYEIKRLKLQYKTKVAEKCIVVIWKQCTMA